MTHRGQVAAEHSLVRLRLDVATHDVVERRGAKRSHGHALEFAAADDPHIAGVICSRGWRNRTVCEQPFGDREHLVG